MKASRPSLVSSDCMTRANSSLVIRFSVSSSSSADASTTCRLAQTASGAAAVICSASSKASFVASPGSTRREISPRPYARSAGDRLAGQDHLHRRGLPDRPRQAEQSTGAGDQVALDLGEAERRSSRRDDEVGGQHDLASARGGKSVDRDDDRLRRSR